jgi:hypothetical protein
LIVDLQAAGAALTRCVNRVPFVGRHLAELLSRADPEPRS